MSNDTFAAVQVTTDTATGELVATHRGTEVFRVAADDTADNRDRLTAAALAELATWYS